MRGPRVETRGYSLTSLTGLTLGAPLISGPNPGLFSVAPLGLQEQARVAGDGFFPPLLSPAGGGGFFPPLVAPATGVDSSRLFCPPRRGWILPASCVPRWRGWPPKAAGGGFEPRNFGQGMQICPTPFGVGPLGLSGIPCSPSTGPPSGSTGDTVSRRGRRLEHVPVLVRCGTGALAERSNGDPLSRRR
jgi:hypothetical protein